MMCMDTKINSGNGEGLGFHQGRLISFSLTSIHLDPRSRLDTFTFTWLHSTMGAKTT